MLFKYAALGKKTALLHDAPSARFPKASLDFIPNAILENLTLDLVWRFTRAYLTSMQTNLGCQRRVEGIRIDQARLDRSQQQIAIQRAKICRRE